MGNVLLGSQGYSLYVKGTAEVPLQIPSILSLPWLRVGAGVPDSQLKAQPQTWGLEWEEVPSHSLGLRA